MSGETVWTFATKRFRVTLTLEFVYGFQYDGDDSDGETQRALDCGECVAFDSVVTVYLDDKRIGWDSLGSSVYESNRVREFYTAHRDPDPMKRNCTIMRAKQGTKVSICHYFPDMVSNAIDDARRYLASVPEMRQT